VNATGGSSSGSGDRHLDARAEPAVALTGAGESAYSGRMADPNRQIVLRSRPKGAVHADNFEAKSSPIPAIGPGEALVKTLYLSIDPTIRGWMERDTYLPAIELGAPIRSAGAGVVVQSNNPRLPVGDRVFTLVGWQEYAVVSDRDKPSVIPAGVALTDALSVFGVTGMTAYFGLMELGKPKAGETVVVSGAAGATGSIVGQLAKSKGCRVVGLAVDAVTEVFGARSDEIRPTPEVGGDRDLRGISGVTRHDGKLTFVLDIGRFLSIVEALSASGAI